MFEILFIVFENVKTLDRKTIWKIRVGIVLYTKNFFQNSQKLDQSGEGNTTFFFLAFVSSVASKANVTDNKQKLVFYNLSILSTEQSTNCKPTHWTSNFLACKSKQTLLVNFLTSQHQNKNVNPNKLFLLVNFSKPTPKHKMSIQTNFAFQFFKAIKTIMWIQTNFACQFFKVNIKTKMWPSATKWDFLSWVSIRKRT